MNMICKSNEAEVMLINMAKFYTKSDIIDREFALLVNPDYK